MILSAIFVEKEMGCGNGSAASVDPLHRFSHLIFSVAPLQMMMMNQNLNHNKLLKCDIILQCSKQPRQASIKTFTHHYENQFLFFTKCFNIFIYIWVSWATNKALLLDFPPFFFLYAPLSLTSQSKLLLTFKT